MKKMTLALLFILLAHGPFSLAMATSSVIKCHSPRLNKSFVINGTLVEVQQQSSGRSLASLRAATRGSGGSMEKMMNMDGHKVIIHLENMDRPNPIDDYVILRNAKGHEITYPIECQVQ